VSKNYGSSNIGSPFESNIYVISFSFSLSYALIHSVGVIIAGLWVLSGLPLKEDVLFCKGVVLGGIPWSSRTLDFVGGWTT
jgi:hypothetical protein